MKSPKYGVLALSKQVIETFLLLFIFLPSASLAQNCDLLKIGSRSSDPEPLGNSQGWLTVCGNLAKLARRRHLGQAGKQSMPCCGSTGPCDSYYLCSPSRLQEAETGEGGLPPCPAQPLSFSPSPSLQPASPLCSDRRAHPSPCEPSLAAMPLPHAPLDPKGRFITPQLPALPPAQHVRSPWPPAKAWSCQQRQRQKSHRSVGFLLPSVLGGFAWLCGALHVHRVDDVKEIFHHSNPLQRDALGLRQAICPL